MLSESIIDVKANIMIIYYYMRAQQNNYGYGARFSELINNS